MTALPSIFLVLLLLSVFLLGFHTLRQSSRTRDLQRELDQLKEALRRSREYAEQQQSEAGAAVRSGHRQGRVHLHRFPRTAHAADQHPRGAGLAVRGAAGQRGCQGAEPAAHCLHQHRAADPADQRHSGPGAHGVRPGAAEAAPLLDVRPGARGRRHHDPHGRRRGHPAGTDLQCAARLDLLRRGFRPHPAGADQPAVERDQVFAGRHPRSRCRSTPTRTRCC